MPSPDAGWALDLAPQKALEWFAKKHISTINYRAISAAEHAKVFTVAGITNLDMLADLHTSLTTALADGTPFTAWKKALFTHLQGKGWVQRVNGKTEIYDPNTGEYYLGGHRLQRIYRTNMQFAYAAQQYQHYLQNVDHRPFWRYDAIMDNRTRPTHAALDGLIYRYDDAFWSSHYPPNGYNCRCSVTALSARDIERSGKTVSQTRAEDVISVERVVNQNGKTKKVNGVRINGKVHTPDLGFDYHSGRMNYRPELDDYPAALAQRFCAREMSGRDFAYHYQRVQDALPFIKKSLGVPEGQKLSAQQLLSVRQRLSVFNTYAAGMLTEQVATAINSSRRTVWLSDDTLIKQFNSRLGQYFALDEYQKLPAIINNPDYVIADPRRAGFYLLIKNHRQVVVKVLSQTTEVFIQTYHPTDDKKVKKLLQKTAK